MATLYGAVIGGKLYRIDTATGAETVVGDGVNRSYVGVCVDFSGNLYASSADGYVYKFAIVSNALISTYDVASDARSVTFSEADNSIYVACYSAGVLRKINIFSGEISSVILDASIYPAIIDIGSSAASGVALSVGTVNAIARGGDFSSISSWKDASIDVEGMEIISSVAVWVSGAVAGHGALQYISELGTIVYEYPGYATLWGMAIDGPTLYIASTGGKIYSRSSENISSPLTDVTAIDRNWQDICIATDLPPDSPAFYGSPFEGFEAGTVSVEIDRKLTLVDTLGGRPVLIPYAPADKDEWLVTAEFWTSAAQAREIEQRTPPRGSPVYPGISVPARSGENTFAGLAPAATNGSADTYIDPIMLQPLDALGQKDVRVDLYGYRASFSLSCSSVSNPYSSNPATPPTTTPPAWLPRKWRVHSIEDGSNERRVIGPDGKWTGSGNPIAVNPIRPLSIQCDHLTTDQANELVAFFRGIRGSLFSLGFYPGPVGPDAPANPDFVATKLVCKRDAGLLWSATLEVVAA